MREVVLDIYTILRTDEELMRLLVYPSENLGENIPHPMDYDLPDIVDEDSELYWEQVDNHIQLKEKSTNIEDEALARLYIYPGRRRPYYTNYLMARQEIIIDVLVHESYLADMRLEWINDRLAELLALERLTGSIGMLDYTQGNGWQAPIGYSKYQHMFVFGTTKK